MPEYGRLHCRSFITAAQRRRLIKETASISNLTCEIPEHALGVG
jgi:hypothetical protein